MKAILTSFALLSIILVFGQTNSGPLEKQVQDLIVEDRYKDAVELCERKMKDDRYGAYPYFMLAEVYLRSLPYCGGTEYTDFLLASLAMGVYKKGAEKFNTHDPAVLQEICDRLATIENVFSRDLNTEEIYAVECFGKSTKLYTQKQCKDYYEGNEEY